MKRHRDNERLQQATRDRIPEAAVAWLAAVRAPLEKLTMAALSGEVDDDAFRRMVEEFSAGLPGLMETMDHDALGKLLEDGMGAAMAAGLGARALPAIADGQSPMAKPEMRARLPWETDAWLAGKGRGKRCGNSWIPRWKECKSTVNPGDNKSVLIEWEPATAEEATILSRFSVGKFKAGARMLARHQDIRHVDKNHAHQYDEKDLKQLRKRLFDPRTDQRPSKTKRGEASIEFVFQRGQDMMEAVFTIHFPPGSPGELRLKTFAARKEKS